MPTWTNKDTYQYCKWAGEIYRPALFPGRQDNYTRTRSLASSYQRHPVSLRNGKIVSWVSSQLCWQQLNVLSMPGVLELVGRIFEHDPCAQNHNAWDLRFGQKSLYYMMRVMTCDHVFSCFREKLFFANRFAVIYEGMIPAIMRDLIATRHSGYPFLWPDRFIRKRLVTTPAYKILPENHAKIDRDYNLTLLNNVYVACRTYYRREQGEGRAEKIIKKRRGVEEIREPEIQVGEISSFFEDQEF